MQGYTNKMESKFLLSSVRNSQLNTLPPLKLYFFKFLISSTINYFWVIFYLFLHFLINFFSILNSNLKIANMFLQYFEIFERTSILETIHYFNVSENKLLNEIFEIIR